MPLTHTHSLTLFFSLILFVSLLLLDRCVVLERDSRHFKLYNDELKVTKVVRGHRKAVLDVEHLPEHNVLASCSADQTVCFWDATPRQNEYKLQAKWQLAHAQVALAWNGTESNIMIEMRGGF